MSGNTERADDVSETEPSSDYEISEETESEDTNDALIPDADFTVQQSIGAEGHGPRQGMPTDGPRAERVRVRVPEQLLRLLGRSEFGQIFGNNFVQLNDEDDDDDDYQPRRRARRKKQKPANAHPGPSLAGKELIRAGNFGTANEHPTTIGAKAQSTLSAKLMLRELGLRRDGTIGATSAIAQNMLPSSVADKIIHYDDRCYSGQFSDDGNFFFSCAQDFKVRLYDTSNPYDWRYYKTMDYPYGQWTITDATLSPDNKYLAYSSIRSTVCLSSTERGSTSEPWLFDLADAGRSSRTQRRPQQGYSRFGIWSLRFSGDGREIVAGTSRPSVCVYDIEKRKTVIDIHDSHKDDVNAVCFGDTTSPHVLYSGSDDTNIKIWDRRSLGDGRAAGVFVGHTEGLTYVDSKGDGRYVLSNGKDQTMKLWDLRKMISSEKAAAINTGRYTTNFDYRFMAYPDEGYRTNPHDCSVVTYRGHSVLKTLIRCHFAPPNSTDSRYLYTGSEDGSVFIYNVDATLAAKISVNKATANSRAREPVFTAAYAMDGRDRNAWKTCVRDASWHPSAPMIAATSWNGWGMSTGTCTVHSWNDGLEDDEGHPRMGQSVDQRLNPEDDYETRGSRLRSRRIASLAPAIEADDDDDPW